MDSIAKTSLLTAAMRAVESKRSDRMFNDPYAELLAGEEGVLILNQAIKASGDQPAVAIRTSFIDKKIESAINKGAHQVVILASGMDTRAYRMPFPKQTKIFELDRKEVFDYKHEKLKLVKSACEHMEIAVDLRDDWRSKLTDSGFQKNVRTIWLVEGLLMYLDEPDALGVLNKIDSLASPQDILIFDILSRTLLDAPFMQNQLNFLASLGAPWKFGTDEPEAMMRKIGWTATTTQAGEFAPSRWPFPTAPRHVPNVPRGFFVEAIKD